MQKMTCMFVIFCVIVGPFIVEGTDNFEVLNLRNCANAERINVKKSTQFTLSGEVSKTINTDENTCLAECLRDRCRFGSVTTDASGFICTHYDKPTASGDVITGVQVAYLYDYCPNNTERTCLPTEDLNFDNQMVFSDHGITFTPSLTGHGLAIGGNGYAVLASYDVENCIVRPHLCTDGFTLAFYAKIGINFSNWAGIISSRSYEGGFGEGFVCFTNPQNNYLGCEVYILGSGGKATYYTDISIPTDWDHIAMTYDHSADKLYLYYNGDIVDDTYNSVNPNVVPNTYKRVLARAIDANSGANRCNCELDDVQIFEIALSEAEIEALYNYD